jgi:flagella basal body P-ring formation protein FlgA
MILAAAVAITCIAVEGDRILAADMSKAVPAFAALAADVPLGFAPAPGARRVFGAREVARLSARYGIDANSAAGACFERATGRLTEARVAEALRAAIGRDDARIEVLDFPRYQVPRGELRFPAAPASVPPPAPRPLPLLFRGRIVYGEKHSVPAWAKARITVPGKRAVALEDLPAGRPIQKDRVEIVDAELCPFSEVSVGSAAEIAGRLLRRSVPRGAPLFSSLLESPKQVERGQTVEVEVLSGRAALRLEGRAESGGNAGETVTVRNPDTGRRFTARVEGKGKVIVDAKENAGVRRAAVRGGNGR